MSPREKSVFVSRERITLTLPLEVNTRILYPEQVLLALGNRYIDVGSLCYSRRLGRRGGRPVKVVVASLQKKRRAWVMRYIEFLNLVVRDKVKRPSTLMQLTQHVQRFADWADNRGLVNWFRGGDDSQAAYSGWIEREFERYRRQEVCARYVNKTVSDIHEALTSTLLLDTATRKTRKIALTGLHSPTEPLGSADFSHAMALNVALFTGLCDLVLNNKPFPYKLVLPATVERPENSIWLNPTSAWPSPTKPCEPRSSVNAKRRSAYDQLDGRVFSPEEIIHRYTKGRTHGERMDVAKAVVKKAMKCLEAANRDARHWRRLEFARFAQDTFLFMFLGFTGANESVALEIEVDGNLPSASSVQQFRSIKFRAGGKRVTLLAPLTFVPYYLRYLELRRYLLAEHNAQWLFFTRGRFGRDPVRQRPPKLWSQAHSQKLRKIDPRYVHFSARRLRANFAEWYQNHGGTSITALVLQNTEKTTSEHYNVGTVTDFRDEMSSFLNAIADAAKRQRVVRVLRSAVSTFDEGGGCRDFGNPSPLAQNIEIVPNCRERAGCLFCSQRVLIANEHDVRKVASAAFVMEHLITSPRLERELRPLITKCEEDLKKIATHSTCVEMVERVRREVFEEGHLTPYFTDKYYFYSELGMIR